MQENNHIVKLPVNPPSMRLMRAVAEMEASSAKVTPFPGTIAGLSAELDMINHRAANDSFKAELLAYGKTITTSRTDKPSFLEYMAAAGLALCVIGAFSFFIN